MAQIKGLIIAAAVASGLALTGCANQGSSACGNGTATPVAVPVAAPMPQAACKNVSHCKHKMMGHHHKKMHAHHHAAAAKKDAATSSATTNSTDSSSTSNG